MLKITADFETTTDPNDCRVWAWAVCGIDDNDYFQYGTDIDGFINYLYTQKRSKVFFHNLKFDGEFIVQYLYRMGYKYVDDRERATSRSFTTLISNMGAWYTIEIFFEVEDGVATRKATIHDSLKILNFSVEQIAKDFDLPISKLTLDYETKREIGHDLTPHEIDYIRNDVEIMARALNFIFSQGHTKITIGSDALAHYKKLTPNFRVHFPELPPEIDADIRASYKGGFTYLSPVHQNEITGKGITLDINSAYPVALHNELQPYGAPVYFEGAYKFDPEYPLYVIKFTCIFELKPNKIPSIQLKRNIAFKPNEYIASSNGQTVELCLTNPDYELFLQQYDVYDIEYIGGYKFKGATGLFSKYIDYWIEQKIKSKKEGNKAQTRTAKLFLNSLYGKFGLNVNSGTKKPVIVDGLLHYTYVDADDTRKPVYIPVATFTTAYVRKFIITSSQTIRDWSLDHKGYDAYVYSDTDSIHCLLDRDDLKELSKFMKIDDYELGAWAFEVEWQRGKFLRQKCYIEENMDGEIEVTVAGLPKTYAPLITFDNFRIGFNTGELDLNKIKELGIKQKLRYRHVDGGVVLQPTDFTIK